LRFKVFEIQCKSNEFYNFAIMLNQFLEFVNKQKLFQSEEKVLLAVSGGIDSVVMMHLFKEAKLIFGIAHCNFQLRADESDGDEAFVRALSSECNVPLFVSRFETENYASNHGISIQMAARELRREWFNELMKKEHFSKIATAHHLNDSLETAIFNLSRGTGILGLQGILPLKEGYIRPLLFASREMIHEYAKSNKLDWREDRTNSSVKYSRNLIRHHVIPELKKINPNLEFTFSQSMEKISAASRIYKNFIAKQKATLLHTENGVITIDKNDLSHTIEPEIVLFEALEEYDFNFAQVKDILAVFEGQPGKIFYSSTHQLFIDREKLIIEKKDLPKYQKRQIFEDTGSVELEKGKMTFKRFSSKQIAISTDKNVAMLDLDKLQFPLLIRTWKHGDVFYPLGMKGKKKVSDFMIDEKIPVNLKKQTLTLFSGNDLVWVVGHRIDERYKITEQTNNILRIYFDIS
jgi:tRNA(Ile)-lysidine synthase